MRQDKLFTILTTTILCASGYELPGLAQTSGETSEKTTAAAADSKSDKSAEPKSAINSKEQIKVDGAPNPNTLKLNPALIPHLTRAYSLLSKGDNQGAISSLNQALKIDPKSIQANRYLAFARMRSGQSKDALKIMQDLSKHTALDNFDWYVFAESYHEQGADAIAVACYEQSLKIFPAYDAARAGLVKALTGLGQYDRARQEIATGFKLTKEQKIKEFYDQMKETVSYVERVDTEQRFGEQTGLSNEQMSRPGDKPIVINPGLSTDGY